MLQQRDCCFQQYQEEREGRELHDFTQLSCCQKNNKAKIIFAFQISIGRNQSSDKGFLGGSVVKNPPADAGDLGWVDPLEKEMAARSSILAQENPVDTAAWLAVVYRVTKESNTTYQLSSSNNKSSDRSLGAMSFTFYLPG